MSIYSALDSFLNTETWHTSHDLDDERFYRALAKIVRNDDFNADAMCDYMRANKGLAGDDQESGFAKAIDRRTQDAWAVADYLRYGEPKSTYTLDNVS